MKRLIAHMRSNMSHSEWEEYCADFITGLIAFLVVLLFAGAWGVAEADDAVLTWDASVCTGNCTDAAGYRIYKEIAEIDDPTVLTFTVPGLPSGEHRFIATAIDSEGVESSQSNHAEKTSTGLHVTDDKAYTLIQASGRFILIPYGIIPIGTECDETTTVNGFYGVPVDLVVPTGTVNPQTAVAKCG